METEIYLNLGGFASLRVNSFQCKGQYECAFTVSKSKPSCTTLVHGSIKARAASGAVVYFASRFSHAYKRAIDEAFMADNCKWRQRFLMKTIPAINVYKDIVWIEANRERELAVVGLEH